MNPLPYSPMQDNPVAQMVRWLQSTTLFRDLADEEVKLLLRQCGTLKVGMFEVVCAENEPGETLFYIIDGQVYLTRQIGEEEEFLALLGKGNSFGEAGLLGENVRTATARARQKTVLLTIEKDVIHSLPTDLALKVMRNIAVTSGEKLKMANKIIDRLYEQLRALRPKNQDWKAEEERFVQELGENPPV